MAVQARKPKYAGDFSPDSILLIPAPTSCAFQAFHKRPAKLCFNGTGFTVNYLAPFRMPTQLALVQHGRRLPHAYPW